METVMKKLFAIGVLVLLGWQLTLNDGKSPGSAAAQTMPVPSRTDDDYTLLANLVHIAAYVSFCEQGILSRAGYRYLEQRLAAFSEKERAVSSRLMSEEIVKMGGVDKFCTFVASNNKARSLIKDFDKYATMGGTR